MANQRQQDYGRQNQEQGEQKQSDQQQSVTSHPIGPTSTQGVEASDLPDKGRGGVEMDPHHQKSRKLPQQTGENDTGDVGIRAFPASADASDHGYRKGN